MSRCCSGHTDMGDKRSAISRRPLCPRRSALLVRHAEPARESAAASRLAEGEGCSGSSAELTGRRLAPCSSRWLREHRCAADAASCSSDRAPKHGFDSASKAQGLLLPRRAQALPGGKHGNMFRGVKHRFCFNRASSLLYRVVRATPVRVQLIGSWSPFC